jgi:hypothetical protein
MPFFSAVEAGAVLALAIMIIEFIAEGVFLTEAALIVAAHGYLLIRNENGVSKQRTNLPCTLGSQRSAVVGTLASHVVRLTTALVKLVTDDCRILDRRELTCRRRRYRRRHQR